MDIESANGAIRSIQDKGQARVGPLQQDVLLRHKAGDVTMQFHVTSIEDGLGSKCVSGPRDSTALWTDVQQRLFSVYLDATQWKRACGAIRRGTHHYRGGRLGWTGKSF